MRTVVITGMPGCGMREVRERLLAGAKSLTPEVDLHIEDVGDGMFEKDILDYPRPKPKREEWEEKILDRPRSTLSALRKAVLETIMAEHIRLDEQESREEELGTASRSKVFLVFAHATFFWRHTLHIGTPFASLDRLSPHFFVTIVDDLERVAGALYKHRRWEDLSLEEIVWWRAVETTTTAAVAAALGIRHFVVAKEEDIRTLANLIAHPPPEKKCVYASYPMSHVGKEELQESRDFIEELRKHFIVFDPSSIRDVEYAYQRLFDDYQNGSSVDIQTATLEELTRLPGCGPKLAQRIADYRSSHKPLQSVDDLINVAGIGRGLLQRWQSQLHVGERPRKMDRRQLERVRKQLQHQTAHRDYDLIDQSDYVMVHYTRTAVDEESGGATGREDKMPLSPGVICEMKHAYTHGKKVYAVWQSKREPSPFFDFYCTVWKRDKGALLAFLRHEGIIDA
jgi:competence ComEA-like helix-hairpin-helix protein